jgi:hypothetical protein
MDLQEFQTLMSARDADFPKGAWGNQPAVPASNTDVVNTSGHPVQVCIVGGTVTAIKVDDVTTGATNGPVTVRPNSKISITYSAAPTWEWLLQ